MLKRNRRHALTLAVGIIVFVAAVQVGLLGASRLVALDRTWPPFLEEVESAADHEQFDLLLKSANGYIGLDEDGNISLFEGPPEQQNVVRSFYQIDMESLEANMSDTQLHELIHGIRVTDHDECLEVLASYSAFAVSAVEEAHLQSANARDQLMKQ